MHVTIIADASWCPETHAAGYAFWIASSRGKQGGSGALKDAVVSSSAAEMMALINGLYFACRDRLAQKDDIVLLQTDCLGAIQAFQGQRGRMNDDELKAKKYFEELVSASGVLVRFRHVKGHTDGREPRLYINNKCDELARQAMRRARGMFRAAQHNKRKETS